MVGTGCGEARRNQEKGGQDGGRKEGGGGVQRGGNKKGGTGRKRLKHHCTVKHHFSLLKGKKVLEADG